MAKKKFGIRIVSNNAIPDHPSVGKLLANRSENYFPTICLAQQRVDELNKSPFWKYKAERIYHEIKEWDDE